MVREDDRVKVFKQTDLEDAIQQDTLDIFTLIRSLLRAKNRSKKVNRKGTFSSLIILYLKLLVRE